LPPLIEDWQSGGKPLFLTCSSYRIKLSRVPKPGGDAIDSCRKRVVQIVGILAAAFTPQQLNLNQTQRIDVRVS
jgi:hypothetical protein